MKLNTKTAAKFESLEQQLQAAEEELKQAKADWRDKHGTALRNLQRCILYNDVVGRVDQDDRDDPEVLLAGIRAHPHHASYSKMADGKEIFWSDVLAPHVQEYSNSRPRVRDAQKKVKRLTEEIEPLENEISDAHSAEFGEHISAMRNYLHAIYEPLCMAGTAHERAQQLETLFQNTPRFQLLLLLKNHSTYRGETAAKRISAMLSALRKLDQRRAEDLAAMTPKLPAK
jgi:septal ring factor EnvC (AmiA/AmiB activator)